MIPKEQLAILLVCGGRNYSNSGLVASTLDHIIKVILKRDPNIKIAILTGGAKGADFLAKNYALNNALTYIEVPACWNSFGHAAGPIRNQSMLDVFNIEIVIAFPGGKGTADMVSRAISANVSVLDLRGSTNEIQNS